MELSTTGELFRFRLQSAGWLHSLCVTLAAVVTLLGILVMLGWYLQTDVLIQISTAFPPMQFNTALCFVLTGGGGILLLSKRLRPAVVCGLLVSLLAGLTLLQYVTGMDFFIDQLLMNYTIASEATVYPGRMAPETALSFVLCGLILSSCQSGYRLGITFLLSSVVVGFSSIALLGYLFSLEVVYSWEQQTRMAVHTALGFICFGSVFLLWGFSCKEITDQQRFFWFSLVNCLALSVLLVTLWQALCAWEDRRIRGDIAHQIGNAGKTIDILVSSEIDALERMAKRWSFRGSMQQNEWLADARAYVEDIPVFQAIEWVDEDFRVRWIYPFAGNEAALNLDHSASKTRREALLYAKATGQVTVTRTIDLTRGGKGFLIYVPIYVRDRFDGFILGVVRVDELMHLLLENQVYADRFKIEVFDDQLIWESGSETAYVSEFATDTWLILKNVSWRASFTPPLSYVEQQRSPLPGAVLISGFLLIGLLSGVLYFYFRSRIAIFQREEKTLLLKQSNQALHKAEQRYRVINFLMPVGVLVVNRQGVIVEDNQQAAKMFGYQQGELVGINVEVLLPESLRQKHVKQRKAFFKEGQTRRMGKDNSELMGLTKQNTFLPVEVGLSPLEIDNEKFVVASIIDMSERHRMLKELKNQNIHMDHAIEKLRRSNEQLERFAFVCSHDLQEPLRMVLSFSQLLEKRLPDSLDDKSREYLSYITDGAARARGMIIDILSFCRLDQNTDAREQVAVGEVCQQVHNTLSEVLNERRAEFNWQADLPVIEAVPSQLFQLLLNLVNNGLKFNRSDIPTVSISADDAGDYWQLQIADNGIGIEPQYRHKLFQIFQRLNAKTEFSGSGIGLAICKKIVEHHAAQISIESADGQGSRFVILWPKMTLSESNAEIRVCATDSVL